MEIAVCIRRVPDTAEAELEVASDGRGIELEDLSWDINEWDNFAVETAVQLKEKHGGRVTALTVGPEDDEEVLRRALAMGADAAVHLNDPAFVDLDAHGIAMALVAALETPVDLVLCGAISSDRGTGAVGGLLAARLDVPYVALATALDVADGVATVRHEVEGGQERVVAVDLPAVVSVQTGICEPRYVSIRGIRKVAGAEIPVKDAAALGVTAERRIQLEEVFVPPRGEGAEILEGDDEEMVEALVERLYKEGGLS